MRMRPWMTGNCTTENRKRTAVFPEKEEIFSESWEIWPTVESMSSRDHRSKKPKTFQSKPYR